MELEQTLLGNNQLKITKPDGQILPDPNLIWNIDHMIGFIQMELDAWKVHVRSVNAEISQAATPPSVILLKKQNVRIYIKSLFNVATYYISCVRALEQLIKQLHDIKKETGSKAKPEPINVNEIFHEKTLKFRDKSFIHQNSTKITNEMDKRTLMFWSPELTCLTNESPNCESYLFGNSQWNFESNGTHSETELNIEIRGFTDFASTALHELDIRKKRVEKYFMALNATTYNSL